MGNRAAQLFLQMEKCNHKLLQSKQTENIILRALGDLFALVRVGLASHSQAKSVLHDQSVLQFNIGLTTVLPNGSLGLNQSK